MTTPHPAPPGGSDADAISRSLSEPGAFEVVFERHFQAIHAFAQRRVGRDLAEEVAAETFARGFDARRRYDTAHVDARPWLLGIACNVMRRHWRTERRRLAAYEQALRHARPAEVPDVAGDTIGAVARLPRRQREVLLLHAWADLSYEQVGQALGLAPGTVRSRLARARSSVRAGAAVHSGPTSPFGDAKEPSRA